MPNSPHPDLRLEVHPPSTPPTRSRARSTSPTHTTPSAGPSRPLSPNPRFTASPRLDQSPILGRDGYEPARGGGGLAGIGRAIAQRVLRAVRRGNLPFMLVFITYVLIPHGDRRAWHLIRRCVIVFFTSLAGIGYVPPDEIETTVAFLPGTPVFDLAGRQAQERRMEEQRVLEESWAKKKRPKDVGFFNVSSLTYRERGCRGQEMIKHSGEISLLLLHRVRLLRF